MTFDQHASYFEQGPFRALRSRASSATMFITRRPLDHIDDTAAAADMIIAQELLGRERPQIPPQLNSFNHAVYDLSQRRLEENCAAPLTSNKCRNRRLVHNSSSNTWTSSSGDGSEGDENDDRTMFVQEYNRMARKYGVEIIDLIDFGAVEVERISVFARHGSWIKRKLLRRTSSTLTTKNKPEKQFRHKRSITDLSLQMRAKKDTFKGKDLEDLIRLCGSSILYLPAEYAADTLALPTCFRATAQYLAQYGSASHGIFRIPGSHVTVNALYNHYAFQDGDGETISGTVRRPILPGHIKYDVNDVASAFKKFLAGLPAGILGSVWLFNTFASIHCQLDVDTERTKTRQSKIRARMIALAIASTVSRYQREFICAVMGLLSMIGRAAETAPREDEHERPLPTSDLMGYRSLGIIFGPLLLGELLERHDSCLDRTLTLSRPARPKLPRGRHKKNKSADDTTIFQKGIDKVRIANSIVEMLITHWREVVRQMKNLGALKSAKDRQRLALLVQTPFLRPSASELFTTRGSQDLESEGASIRHVDRSISSTPSPRVPPKSLIACPNQSPFQRSDNLSVKKRRSRPRLIMPSQMLSGVRSMSVLSPTKEESNLDEQYGMLSSDATYDSKCQSLAIRPSQSTQTFHTTKSEPQGEPGNEKFLFEATQIPKPASTGEEDFPCSETRLKPAARLVRKISEPAMVNVKHIAIDYIPKKFMNLQTHPDPASISEDDFSRDRPQPTDYKHPTISSLNEEYGQSARKSKHVRLVSSPTGSLETLLNESRFLAHVPVPSVPERKGQGAANELDPIPLSGSPETLYTHQATLGKQNCGSYFRSGSSQTRDSFTKDPLTRISQEEDMASLVSLAQVIHSRGQNTGCSPQSKSESEHHSNVIMGTNVSPKKKHPANIDRPEPRANNQMRNTGSETIYERESPSTTTITITKRLTDRHPITPRRPVTDPVLPGRDRSGSVKKLAAKYNGGTPVPAYFSSLTKSLERPVSCPKCELTAILSEASNHTLEPWSNTPYKAQNSSPPFRKQLLVGSSPPSPLASPLSRDIMESPLYPKPLSINRRQMNEARSPCWLDIAPMVPLDSKNDQKCKDKSVMPTSLRRLCGQGNSNDSLTNSRQLSMDILIPVPDELPPKSYVTSADISPYTPTPNVVDDYQFSRNYFHGASRGSKASITSEMPSTSIRGYDGKIRGASLLYTQIQSLQRQLRAKADEVDHAKRQLMAKESLQDLSTLAEQLRQAKREIEMWRSRTEAAEKRLGILSQFLPKQNVFEPAKRQSLPTKGSIQYLKDKGIHDTEDEEFFVDQIRTALDVGGDGTRSDNGSHTSYGTVRRVSPSHEVSDCDLNVVKVPFVEAIIEKFQGPYELE